MRHGRLNIWLTLSFAITAVILGNAQLNGIQASFGPRIYAHIEAAGGIIHGYPHWRIYQSRVLGPFLSLRNVLLVKEMGPGIFVDAKASGRFFNVQLLRNFTMVKSFFTQPQGFYFRFNAFILLIPALAFRAMFCRYNGVIRISILHILLWVVTVTFGLIYETRVWISFVPFLILVIPVLLPEMKSSKASFFTV